MVDQPERSHLALLLRRLASGRITNDEFEEARPSRAPDAGLQAVADASWTLYSDHRRYRLRGRDALGREAMREVGRWIVFLRSGREYEWPPAPSRGVLDWVVAILSFGSLDLRRWVKWPQWRSSGDFAVWPFIRRADYEEAIRRPWLFTGGLEPAA